MSFVFERPDLAQVQGAPRTRSSPRRTHNKSRLGCQTCKKRRIKCDESTPKCGQCRDKGTECVYNQKPPASTERPAGQDPESVPIEDSSSRDAVPVTRQNATANPPSLTTPEPMPRELAKARILMHLELIDIPQSQSNANASDEYQRQHICHLLDHFAETNFPWAGSPQCQRVLQTWGLTLAVTNPFLMHGILAFSASHLRRLSLCVWKAQRLALLNRRCIYLFSPISILDRIHERNSVAVS